MVTMTVCSAKMHGQLQGCRRFTHSSYSGICRETLHDRSNEEGSRRAVRRAINDLSMMAWVLLSLRKIAWEGGSVK